MLVLHAINRNVGVGYNVRMAWDTEGTRRRLKEAATVEFAEQGPDGTTMARIADRAGINKERLYNYFGDKQTLFATVLRDELEKLAAATPTLQAGLADIGELAGQTYDYHAAHPELVRLLQWEGLAGVLMSEDGLRSAYYREKVRAVSAAQEAGLLDDDLDPDHLMFLIIALAAWWSAVPQLATAFTGADVDDPAEHTRRRGCVVRAAQRLALPPAAST